MDAIDEELVDRATALADAGDRVILGIAGEPGAGKTTLTVALLAALRERHVPVAWLPMDGFHLGDRSLTALGLLDRKGAIETFDGWGYVATVRRVLTEQNNPVYVPGFERTIEQPIAADLVIPPGPALILTEGNYLLDDTAPWLALRDIAAEIWFVEVDPDTRRSRLVARHVESGKSPADAEAWVTAVDEANAQRIRAYRDAADLVVMVPA